MKISIVTISFNQGAFLEKAIRSVIEQRNAHTDVEYVVVDAGSTDESRHILEKYRGDIDCLIIEPDAGPADGLNKGFSHTTGDVLGFLNADDWLEPRALETVASFFSNRAECDALIGALKIVNETSGSRPQVRLPLPFTLQRFIEGRTIVLQQSTFFRRSAWARVNGFNTANHSCWDAELFRDMLVSGVNFCTLPRLLAGFRLHGTSISGTNSMIEEYAMDMQRIREGTGKDSHPPGAALLHRLRYYGWRARPLTRLRELKTSLTLSAP